MNVEFINLIANLRTISKAKLSISGVSLTGLRLVKEFEAIPRARQHIQTR
jgi:hypothetical protein